MKAEVNDGLVQQYAHALQEVAAMTRDVGAYIALRMESTHNQKKKNKNAPAFGSKPSSIYSS